jgi:histone H3
MAFLFVTIIFRYYSSDSSEPVSRTRSNVNANQSTPKSSHSRKEQRDRQGRSLQEQQQQQKAAGAAKRKGKNQSAPKKLTMEQQIRYLQNLDKPMIPLAPFCRLIKEISQGYMDNIRYTKEAIDSLRTITEAYIIELFGDSYRCATHAKRVTLLVRDIQLLIYLRGPTDPGYKMF